MQLWGKLKSDWCIHHFIRSGAERNHGAGAIAAPGRKPLSYGHLCELIAHVVVTLNAMSVGRNDRVAIVLPMVPRWPLPLLV